MRYLKNFGIITSTVLVCSWSSLVYSQSGTGGSPNSMGVFAGFTDHDGGSTSPTLGLELDHTLAGPWSVGGVLEYTSSGYRDRNSTLVLGTLNYRPPEMPRFKLIGGAGYEFNRFGDDVRLRAGFGYDVVQGPITLTPRLSLDFGNGREDLVLGATAYFGF